MWLISETVFCYMVLQHFQSIVITPGQIETFFISCQVYIDSQALVNAWTGLKQMSN